jgi:uncharacterized protein with HEPN domain
MNNRTELLWLADIVAWGERLQRHLAGIDRDAFFRNEMAQDAFCKCIEAVGEAAGKLDDLNPQLDRTVPGLNLKLARRMRDRISHGYFRIDLNVVWDTAIVSIPETVQAAKSLINEHDGGDGAGGGASGGPPT